MLPIINADSHSKLQAPKVFENFTVRFRLSDSEAFPRSLAPSYLRLTLFPVLVARSPGGIHH